MMMEIRLGQDAQKSHENVRKKNRHFFIRSQDIHTVLTLKRLENDLYTELSTLSTCIFAILLWNSDGKEPNNCFVNKS